MTGDEDQDELDPETLRLMKEALKRPAELSKFDTVDFLVKKVDLGWPTIKPYGGRGPRPRRTQYDDARDRRADLYRRLVKAPRTRAGAAEKIEQIAKDIRGARTAKKVWLELRRKFPSSNTDIGTVRKHMQKLGYLKPRRIP